MSRGKNYIEERNNRAVSVLFVLLIIGTLVLYFTNLSPKAIRKKVEKLSKTEEIINDQVIIDNDYLTLKVSDYKNSPQINNRVLKYSYTEKSYRNLQVKIKTTEINDRIFEEAGTNANNSKDGSYLYGYIYLSNRVLETMQISKINTIGLYVEVRDSNGNYLFSQNYLITAENATKDDKLKGKTVYSDDRIEVVYNKIYDKNEVTRINFGIKNVSQQTYQIRIESSINNEEFQYFSGVSNLKPGKISVFDQYFLGGGTSKDMKSVVLKIGLDTGNEEYYTEIPDSEAIRVVIK